MDSSKEDELYNELKQLPDFDRFPLPTHWYKKYNIPFPNPFNTKEFIQSDYTFKMMFSPKELDPIILNEPQKDLSGNVIQIKMVEEEPIDVKVISRPYDPEKRFSLDQQELDHQDSS